MCAIINAEHYFIEVRLKQNAPHTFAVADIVHIVKLYIINRNAVKIYRTTAGRVRNERKASCVN